MEAEEKRKSKDQKVNVEERKLHGFLGQCGWSILNGNFKGDEEGELIYTEGREDSVMDYVIGDERGQGKD